jgi:hypothetical protein
VAEGRHVRREQLRQRFAGILHRLIDG